MHELKVDLVFNRWHEEVVSWKIGDLDMNHQNPYPNLLSLLDDVRGANMILMENIGIES